MTFLLRNLQALGDAVVTTAAARDLHRATGGRAKIQVLTAAPDIWRNNPYIQHVQTVEEAKDLPLIIDFRYEPSEETRVIGHMLQLHYRIFERATGQAVPLTEFRGDVHLSEAEKQPPTEFGVPARYWLLSAGCKPDRTWKAWSRARYQAVVDSLRGYVDFVQVGAAAHINQPFAGVTNLVGQTSVRDLVRLTYHAAGVLSSITGLMHLAAALQKPAVVIAGGAENPWYSCYPNHQILHTIGELPCCSAIGCGKWRTIAMHDDDPHDDQLCERPSYERGEILPECLTRLSPDRVAEIIAGYRRNP
jgi:ADP-heptose:LPS heptosyltransferase